MTDRAKPWDPICSACGEIIQYNSHGHPYIKFQMIRLCADCAIQLIKPIYKLGGCGGIQHIAFRDMLNSNYNRKNRKQISRYKLIFNELGHRYKFQCVKCKTDKNLTIDHIIPVSKGGGDEISNLQLMCKPCNSRKGARVD